VAPAIIQQGRTALFNRQKNNGAKTNATTQRAA